MIENIWENIILIKYLNPENMKTLAAQIHLKIMKSFVQTFHQKRYTNGKVAHGNIFKTISH